MCIGFLTSVAAASASAETTLQGAEPRCRLSFQPLLPAEGSSCSKKSLLSLWMSYRSSWGNLLLYRSLSEVISEKIRVVCWKRSSSFLQRCVHEDALLSARAARLNLHQKTNQSWWMCGAACTLSSAQLLSPLEMRLLGPLGVPVGFLLGFWFLETWSFVLEIFLL